MDYRMEHGAESVGKGSSRRADEPKERSKGTDSDPASATTTVVGPSIIIRGKLKCNEDLVIKGRVDAEITSTKAVHVEHSGIVKANITARSVTINGVLVGNLTAESRTEIASDGRVVGDMHTPKLVISDGATIRGRIDMPNFDAPRVATVVETPVVEAPVMPPPPLLATPPPMIATSEQTAEQTAAAPPEEAPPPVNAVELPDTAAWTEPTSPEQHVPAHGSEPHADGMGGGLRRMLFDKGKKRRP
jgi:cytoskeletal protein CcmA (bactofilin family)